MKSALGKKSFCQFILYEKYTRNEFMKNRLRMSCATAVGAGILRNWNQEGAVQSITAAIWFRFASPKFLLYCVPQKLHIAAERYHTLKDKNDEHSL